MSLINKIEVAYRAHRFRRRTEKTEVAFMLKHLKKGDVAIDIGANKGAYTYLMRRAVGGEICPIF